MSLDRKKILILLYEDLQIEKTARAMYREQVNRTFDPEIERLLDGMIKAEEKHVKLLEDAIRGLTETIEASPDQKRCAHCGGLIVYDPYTEDIDGVKYYFHAKACAEAFKQKPRQK